MPVRRALLALVSSAFLVTTVAVPAGAASEQVQKKSFSAPHGRSGTVVRYANRRDPVSNTVTLSADDADGRGGRCTETWVDYSTKPHLHFNPGLLVNCGGGKRQVSNVLENDYKFIRSMGVVVCEVPDTSGPITRKGGNCRGNLDAMDLHSGQRYDAFRVSANQYPSGVKIWRQ